MHVFRAFLAVVAWLALAGAAFNCAADSRALMVNDSLAEQEKYGSASQLVNLLKQPWPLKEDRGVHYRYIPYCYDSEAVRNAFDCSRVQPALSVWSRALGGVASYPTGHNIRFREAKDKNPDPLQRKVLYCLKTENNQLVWNSEVPAETLEISEDTIEPDLAQATVGYDAFSSQEGRHQMYLGHNTRVADVVHEIGHVFGMMHEMIRSDRDDYVRYECRNVDGYRDALQKAMAAEGLTEQVASKKLCEDIAFAVKYDFLGVQFVKSPLGVIMDDGDFDLQSIMLYETHAGGTDHCKQSDTDCPLYRYTVPGDPNSALLIIPSLTEPSAGDITWLKRWYPWTG